MTLKLFQPKASLKQLAWLREHDYFGTLELNKSEAGQLIDEYIEQERIALTKDQRDFLNMLTAADPDYLDRIRRFRQELKEEREQL